MDKTQHRNKMYCYLYVSKSHVASRYRVYTLCCTSKVYIFIYIYYRQSNIVRVPPCAAMKPGGGGGVGGCSAACLTDAADARDVTETLYTRHWHFKNS